MEPYPKSIAEKFEKQTKSGDGRLRECVCVCEDKEREGKDINEKPGRESCLLMLLR